MSALGGQPFLTPYSVSKGALATLTKNAAFALMPWRIRVNDQLRALFVEDAPAGYVPIVDAMRILAVSRQTVVSIRIE